MKSSKIALLVYVFFAVLGIIANIYENETLLLLSKPFVIPSIYFYYFIKTKKVNVLFTIAIFFYYIGESVELMHFADEIYYLIIPYFISNVILCVVCIKRLERIKFKVEILVLIFFILILFLYLFIAILDLFSENSLELQHQIVFYGISLFLLSSLATFNMITKMNFANLNLAIFTFCFIVSAIFYVIYNRQEQIKMLEIIHFSLQMVSYYFLVNFKLNLQKSNS